MMAYAATSPVMSALETVGNRLTGGAFAAGGESALACQGCHSPIGVARGEFPTFEESEGRPLGEFASDTAARGLTCDFCHQISGPDHAGSLGGDGIANAAFLLAVGDTKFGPFDDPFPNEFHEGERSDYLRSSEFCGTCHDVRLGGQDAKTGEPFLRLEDAFTEWKESPYATTDNPFGRVTSCQDCHMSAFPYEPPGTYVTDLAANFPGAQPRSVSSHYFTGVDVALVDFPGQDGDEIDGHGFPVAQSVRRRDLLRATCDFELESPAAVAPGTDLRLEVAITNVGAGHNVPTGFSQERQMWVELIVRDGAGELLYETGTLRDSAHPETGELAPDGNLDDEDLRNLVGTIDPVTLEADLVPGPDHDERPGRNRGLKNFGNEFKRIAPDGTEEEVFVPFLANHMDNGHSIPPLETARVLYDVPVPAAAVGPISVETRLRFRAFPPRFLRTLSAARPDLIDEALVDRNRIVDMAEAEASIALAP